MATPRLRSKKLSEPTIARLPVYQRIAEGWYQRGERKIDSKQIGDQVLNSKLASPATTMYGAGEIPGGADKQLITYNPSLMAAANSSGGVMGKMIDAQSICIATAATNQVGNEGSIFRFVFWHSVALAAIIGVIVMLYAYVFPQFIPHGLNFVH